MERRKRRSPVEEYIDSLMDSPEKLERCTQFYQNLRAFYRRKWNCPLKAPYIQGVEVNLFQLYEVVSSFGGWQKVSASEKWSDVAQAIGIADGVAVAEHAIKVLYMRYLSKYEQSETVGDVDDNETELIGSRSRGKGFSSLANADCPISTSSRYTIDLYRGPDKRGEPEYSRLVKGLYSGLPNEVDFAINVCTLLSHPGPRFLRLASAPQLLTLLVAHTGVFADGDSSMYDLYRSWEEASGHNFITFWEGAGIEDEEILTLLPHVKPPKISSTDLELFGGLVHEFRLKDVVSWRVHQILSIVRNLSFEVINKAVMAANWPLMKFLFVCCGCKWSSLRTAALDSLSNIASEIDLLCEESSTTNHLLLKTVSRCLHSGDKLQIIRALEILAGLCNNERNESLLCEFLDYRVLSKIFEVLIVKDMMMCVYTLEALYQISELGAVACQQVSALPHAIETLVNLATVEAVSFGPSGLSGIKVVEFHGPPQLAPPPPQNLPPSMQSRYGPRQATFAAPTGPPFHTPSRAAVAVHSPAIRVGQVAAAVPAHGATAPVIGDSKVEQLTAKWLRLNCIVVPGNIVPRGELYATYVEDLRNHYSALSGSVQMFTNIIKAIFPNVIVRVGTNTTSMVIENLKHAKGQGVVAHEVVGAVNTSAPAAPVSATSTMAASHPVVQKILLGNTAQPTPHLNGHVAPPPPVVERTSVRNEVNVASPQPPATPVADEVAQPSPLPPSTTPIHNKPGVKSAVARRLNGLKEEKVEKLVNGDAQFDAAGRQVVVVASKVITNGISSPANMEIKAENAVAGNQVPTVFIKDVANPSTSATVCNQDGSSETNQSAPVGTPAVPAKRRRTSRCNTPRVNEHTYAEKVVPSTSTDCGGDFMCEWNGCGRTFPTASFVLYHCAKDHVGDQPTLQCHWPRCDSTVRTKLSMITHLQDHHCSEALLLAAAKRRREGFGTVLGPVNPERPRDMHQHPGYAKNAAIEAIRRHAFNYLPRDITDDSEGPVTKSIRLTSSLILRNLARYSTDGRRLIRRHETLLSWLASSRLESSSALSQLLAELYSNQPASSS